MDIKDADGMTPVLVAASRGSWFSVAALLRSGASILERDDRNRNILHLIISIGGRPDQFQDYVCTKVVNNNYWNIAWWLTKLLLIYLVIVHS